MNVINFRPRPKQTALLPLSAQLRDATVKSYQLGGITRESAIRQLEKIGMDPVSAAREIANAL